MSSKWGGISDVDHLMGSHATLKIAAVQFIVISIILIVLQPTFITFRKTKNSTAEFDIIKMLLVGVVIVAGTYAVPPLLKN